MMVLTMSPVAFILNSPLSSAVFTAGIAMLMFLSGIYRKTIYILFVYGVFMVFEYAASNIGNASMLLAISTVSFSLLKCTNIFMLGIFLVRTTSVTEIICALETMKAPNQIVIPFAVAVRFIPSIQEDFSCLKDSLRVRNIRVSIWSFFRHPIQTIEYILVPILIRSYKISEELSASAMLRGLDSGKPKTILHTIKFGIQDFIISAILIGFICSLLYYQHKAD
jgi:energy-coupling factor transport system permease protein